MIRIKKTALCQAIAHCQAAYPYEACGFFSGYRKEAALTIDRFHPVTNVSGVPEKRFLMHPEEMIRILYAVENSGSVIAGILHSHPSGGTAPSSADKALCWTDVPSYWIVSLAEPNRPAFAAYRPGGESESPFEKLEVSILP